MSCIVAEKSMDQLAELISNKMGLHFPKERWNDFERGLSAASKEFGFSNMHDCIDRLLSSELSKQQIEMLAGYLTVGETYFFREKKSFEILENQILPGLIDKRKQKEKTIKIWSAGCATGEEPYSIAILLTRIIPDLNDWNITILATDINPHFLKKAKEGCYGQWSFRDAPLWLKEQYFIKTGDNWFELLPSIKKMVQFNYLNLAENTYPSVLNQTNAMDIIFCRNVIMYFSSELIKKTIQKFYQSLVNGGWLIVSPVETSQYLFFSFEALNFGSITLYRKNEEREISVIPPQSDGAGQNVIPVKTGIQILPDLWIPHQVRNDKEQELLVSKGEGKELDSPHPDLLPQGAKEIKNVWEELGYTKLNNYRVILATAHRRESWGEGIKNISEAILALVEQFKDTAALVSVHPNPIVKDMVKEILKKHERIIISEHIDYVPFCKAMSASYIILTDSGGIQEEAPTLGKPVLVMRDVTERPEAIEAGTARLVGAHKENIIKHAGLLLGIENEYNKMSKAVNPYGDGKAAMRILTSLSYSFGLTKKRSRELLTLPLF